MTSQLVKIVDKEFSNTFVLGEKKQVLLQSRDWDKNIPFPGYLSPFGGAHEGGETPKEAAIRELEEETFMLVNQYLVEPIGTYLMPFNFDKEDPKGFPKNCDDFKKQRYTHWINHLFVYNAQFPITHVLVREGKPEVIKSSEFDLKKFNGKGRPPFMSDYGLILDHILNETDLPKDMIYAKTGYEFKEKIDNLTKAQIKHAA